MPDDAAALRARIIELEAQVAELERDLIHDRLTGLKTRSYFMEENEVALRVLSEAHDERRKEHSGYDHFSVLFIDVDHFKSVNDEHGHAAGDAVLRGVAAAVAEGLRDEDIAARWGGEEMLVSLLGADEDGAALVAERIRTSVAALSFAELSGRPVTVSVGVAGWEPGITLEGVIARADKALYAAKANGRDRIVRFSALPPEEKTG